jgi:hypothetical protein
LEIETCITDTSLILSISKIIFQILLAKQL